MSTWADEFRSTQQRIWEHNHRVDHDPDFNPRPANGFEEYVIDQLQLLLEQPDSVDPKGICNTVAALFCHQQKPEDSWYRFVCAFLSAVESTSDNASHQHLMQLLLEFCWRPEATNQSGADMEMEKNRPGNPPVVKPGEPIVSARGFRYFSDVPGFSMEVREAWNGPASNGPADEPRDPKRVRFANLNAFIAHLALAGTSADMTNFPFGKWPERFGLWTIADALETSNKEKTGDYIRGAANWFRICGRAIYDNPAWGLEDDFPAYEGDIWKARKREDSSADARWQLWMQRAAALSKMPDRDEGVREAAKDCLREMSSVSGSS